MVIDFHTHAFPDALAERAIGGLVANMEPSSPFAPSTNGTLAGLLARMDADGVDKSVLLPVVTKPNQTLRLNEWAAGAASERVIPFGGMYPSTGTYRQDIDLIVSLGLRGIKLHCEYQNFVVDDAWVLPIYDYALSRGLTLVFHSGYDPSFPEPFKSSPQRFRNVWDAMRGGTIVVAHLGGFNAWDDTERYIVGTGLYMDTSTGFAHFPTEQFLRIVRNHGADKVLFATDSPWSRADEELAALRALSLSDEERELILHGNAERLLGLV